MSRYLAAAFALLAMGLCAPHLEAGATSTSVELTPLTLELGLSPGSSHTGNVTVTNPGTAAEHLRVYLQDWTLKADGVIVFAAAGKLPGSACSWIDVAPTEFDLKPGGSATVRYTIRVPAAAPPETRAVILFESNAQIVQAPAGPSRLVPRVGTVLYVMTAPAAAPRARVREFGVSPDGGLFVIENAGETHLRFTGHLEVRSGPELVRQKDLTPFVLLPPPFCVRRTPLPKDWFADLAPGSYQVTVVLDCGGPSLLGAQTALIVPGDVPVMAVKK